MKFLLIVISIAALMFLGAYAHEGDIQAQCKEHGNTGYSTWRGNLNCYPSTDK